MLGDYKVQSYSAINKGKQMFFPNSLRSNMTKWYIVHGYSQNEISHYALGEKSAQNSNKGHTSNKISTPKQTPSH